ncbi:MAG: DinB family protein [Pyrinomonadaceae bacterium]|nr:DinB family protein [Pyrinomonadaceae bacterium]
MPEYDPELYEPKEILLKILDDTQARMTAAIKKLDDASLDSAFSEPSFLEVFPTVRHSLTQVLARHARFHVGQVSVWRRAMGLSAVGRSFR